MDLDWDASPVVPNTDFALLAVDGDFDLIHILIILLIICGVDKDLVEYFVESGDVTDFAKLHTLLLTVEDPHLPLGPLGRSNIGVWSLDDVLEMRDHLILLRNSLAFLGLRL